MIFTKQKTFSELKALIPRLFTRSTQVVAPFNRMPITDQFNLHQSRFSALAELAVFEKLKSKLCEIDIQDELNLMTPNSNLEINVPVLGVVDVLDSPAYNQCPQQFACPMAINGFASKPKSNLEQNFPRADYVLATDIIGNHYELVVNQDGTIEIPKEGMGLFSVLSSITFIFNYNQVVKGFGFENYQSKGVQKNNLYLLPPVESCESCLIKICVSHINEKGKRIVDSIRAVEINGIDSKFEDLKTEIVVSKANESMPEMLAINLGLLFSKVTQFHMPFSVSVSLDKQNHLDYSFTHPQLLGNSLDNHGWLQHPSFSNVFTKHYGLQPETMDVLVRQIYNQYDFMKDYLQGDHFNLSQENGYNNFSLLPEALGNLYDLIIHDVACHKIPGDFILDRIDDSHLSNLDFTQIPVDFHDSVVLSQIQSDLANHNMESLKQLFTTTSNNHDIFDCFNVYANHAIDNIPNAQVHFTAVPYDQEMVLTHHEPLTGLHLHEVLTTSAMMAHGYDLSYGVHIDLDHLLEKSVAWTPSLEQHAIDVPILVHDEDNAYSTRTNVHILPSLEVEIDPSHIHI